MFVTLSEEDGVKKVTGYTNQFTQCVYKVVINSRKISSIYVLTQSHLRLEGEGLSLDITFSDKDKAQAAINKLTILSHN